MKTFPLNNKTPKTKKFVFKYKRKFSMFVGIEPYTNTGNDISQTCKRVIFFFFFPSGEYSILSVDYPRMSLLYN